jgi:spore coat polysaccharide biosynthesis predicted glycosyltransferase SpsG
VTARAALVPDCGGDVGLGHLERMLALADALSDDMATSIAVPEDDAELARRVADRGHNPLALPGPAIDRAGAAADLLATDLFVLDGYVFTIEVQRRLRAKAPLVVVDDLGLPTAANLAVNPSAGGERLRPEGADAFVGGADYALLSSDFIAARLSVMERGHPPRTALVSTGATNLLDITAAFVKEILARDATVDVLAVLGPQSIGTELPDDPRLQVLVARSSLADALARATVYAGTAGTTALQAACVGVPAVVTAAVPNQEGPATALVAAGCAVAAAPAELVRESLRLLDDDSGRVRMAEAGRALVDGQGATRLADRVLRLVRAPAA